MAVLYNGSTQYSVLSSAPVTAAPWTISSWVRPDTDTVGETAFSIGDNAVDDNYVLLALSGTTGGDPAQYIVRNGATNVVTVTSTGFSAGQWHHICGVEISSSSRAVYLDGGGKATDTTSVVPANLGSTSIGRLDRLNPVSFIDGRIGETALWSVALNDNQVKMLAAGVSPLRIRPDALEGYWPGYFVSSMIDYSGNGNVMTVQNSPTLADHAPVQPSWGFDMPVLYGGAAPPVAGAIMNQFQSGNLGADLYNGTIL